MVLRAAAPCVSDAGASSCSLRCKLAPALHTAGRRRGCIVRANVAQANRQAAGSSAALSMDVESQQSRMLSTLAAMTPAPPAVPKVLRTASPESELKTGSELKQKANDCPCENGDHPSQGWRLQPHHLSKQQLWERIRAEVKADAESEPALGSFLHSHVLQHSTIEACLAFLLSTKMANPTLLGTQLMSLFLDTYDDDPSIIDDAIADLQAVKDRDPACSKYSQCVLYFKGYQAVQAHRISHVLWKKGRTALGKALQSRMSEVFHVDIHPAAQLGRGILMDHATGNVIGETAVLGDNVSMLHHVTLGGSGTGRGVRHPTIGHGVLLGAGVSVLGPVSVGGGSKIGAGSVVISDLPCHCVAVGVPAKVIKRDINTEPVKDMDQCLDFIPDYVI